MKVSVVLALASICDINSCYCVYEAAHSALVACKLVTEPLSLTTLSLRDWWVALKVCSSFSIGSFFCNSTSNSLSCLALASCNRVLMVAFNLVSKLVGGSLLLG